MNKLTIEKRAAVIRALVEGCSIRSTVRMSGVAKNTIVKLLADFGFACACYQVKMVRNLSPKRIQCDEIWAFVHTKEKNLRPEHRGTLGLGDIWTWVAIDPDSKLVVTYHVGQRSPDDARAFMLDLAGRITNIVQLTTDGFAAYPEAVRNAFGSNVDYAQLNKVYGQEPMTEARYSPPKINGTRRKAIIGMPHPDHISTSIVERSNLTMRMTIRRFTRLTNAHSKKVENHVHSVALHGAYYNFCRIHESLRVTPAMAAGITKRAFEIEELLGLLDGQEPN